MGKQVKASDLRRRVLRQFRNVWEKNPDKRAYPAIQEVVNPLYAKLGDRVNRELGQAAVNSLCQDGFLEVKVVRDDTGELILARITDKGIEYLSEFQMNTSTRRRANIAIIVSVIALVVSVLDALIRVRALQVLLSQ